MDKRRKNAFFLSNGELLRERTQSFDRDLEFKNKNSFDYADRLCDSCGVRLQSDSWFCKKCNVCFCYDCGKDFGQIQENIFPNCPFCDDKMESGKGLKLIHDKHKILKYATSTRLEFQNEEELIKKLAHLFRQDIPYIRKIWYLVKAENPRALSEFTRKFKDEKDNYLSPVDDTLMEDEPKTHTYNISNIIKIESKNEIEKINLKDAKPIDGLEIEWKQGKMKPVDQKNYRSSFEE